MTSGKYFPFFVISDSSSAPQFPQKIVYAENIFWVFGLVARKTGLSEKIITFLRTMKVGTRPFFWCMHEQPVFLEMGLFQGDHHPVAEKLARNGFYIFTGLSLSMDDVMETGQRMLSFPEFE